MPRPLQRRLVHAALLLTLGLGGVLAAQSVLPPAKPAVPTRAASRSMPGMSMPGNAAQTGASTPPMVNAVPTLRADDTLSMSTPYTPDTKLPDDYRCFVLDPHLKTDQTLTGYEVRPGNASVVHHIILYVAAPDQVEGVRAKDGQDGHPGWSCFGGSGLRGKGGMNVTAAAKALTTGAVGSDLIEQAASSMGGLGIGSWTPGSTATLFPDGTGRVIPKGSLLVMQVHYNTLLARQPDRTSVGLQYAPAGARLQPLRGVTVAAPVELPCPAAGSPSSGSQPSQPQGSCSRAAALKANAERYGQRSAVLPQALLRLCRRTPDDYAGQDPGHVTSTCEIVVNHDATAYGATLHMHTRGVSTSLTLNPETAREQTLLDIPAWDFHWQGSYWYQRPIALHKGDRLRISCTWDNSGPNARYVVWGEGTQDEMCLGSLTVTQ